MDLIIAGIFETVEIGKKGGGKGSRICAHFSSYIGFILTVSHTIFVDACRITQREKMRNAGEVPYSERLHI